MGAALTNIILVIILVVLIGGAVLYLYRQKKKGVHCIGCPHAGNCGKSNCNCKP